jgi:hypothetical protein
LALTWPIGRYCNPRLDGWKDSIEYPESIYRIAYLNCDIIVIDRTMGFAGRKIYNYDFQGYDNVINTAGMHLNLWKGKHTNKGFFEVYRGHYDVIKDVDYVEGSCMLARMEAQDKIGLLDSGYFACWEETLERHLVLGPRKGFQESSPFLKGC